MRDPDTLLKYLPFFSIGGLLVSIFYVNGFFWYLGKHWLTSLSIGDYISLCLPVLPGLLLGVLVGMVSWEDPMWANMDREQRAAERERRRAENPSPPKPISTSVTSRLAEYLAFPGILLAFLAFSTVRDSLPVSQAFWSLGLAVIVTIALALWFFLFSIFRDWVWGLAALAAFAVASLTYSVGQISGATALTRQPDTAIELVDGSSVCASVLVLMEQGPLFSPDGRTTELVNWSQVKSLTRHARCSREGEESA